MPKAEIITIGTEILLGELVDTNTRYIARALRENGVDIYRTSSVGDNLNRIARIIQESMSRAEILITTGGLGPTVDDPTRGAVAQAFGVELVYHEHLWEEILQIYQKYGRTPSENNRRQAYIPAGARPLSNPVGTAPCFIMETPTGAVISLPGVPQEMEHILTTAVLPYLKDRFDLHETLKVKILHTAGVGESQIDEWIGDLELLENPTVGLAAHAGQVDIRITAKGASETEADAAIAAVETQIRERLGQWIYGVDTDTLGAICFQQLQQKGWQLAALEYGLGGTLVSALAQDWKKAAAPETAAFWGECLPAQPVSLEALAEAVEQYRQYRNAETGLGIGIQTNGKQNAIFLVCITPEERKTLHMTHGGPASQAARRAMNYGLDLLRKMT